MAKDATKYIFNEKNLGKGRLVYEIVKQYIQDTTPTYSELKAAFPDTLQGSREVVISKEDKETKDKTSKDTKTRYFTSTQDKLTTKDNVTVYVSTEWGIGNINTFINQAKQLGYELQIVGNTQKSINELFQEYKQAPRKKWINEYESRCSEVKSFQGKELAAFNDEFLKGIWKIPTNGIANASPGIMSNEEFNKLRSELPAITSKILDDPSPDTLDNIKIWAEEARELGKFKSIKWGVINRVFSAANPQDYSTIINKRLIEKLVAKLNILYELNINTTGNWAEINIALMTAIKSQGLQDEDIALVNTFAWELYELLVGHEAKTSFDSDIGTRNLYGDTVSKNLIYYGPPGTGKTYKLQTLLKQDYTDQEVILDHQAWLYHHLEELSWYEIIILVMLDSGDPLKVTDIISHEYYKIKAKINERGAHLRATAWSALQSHSIPESLTVNSSARRDPLVFDKSEDSLWFIVESQKEQLEDYKNLSAQLITGPEQTATIKRYEFVTFHQSYGYEEFVEGLRPINNENGEISYEVKPGVFKRICKRAESDPDNQYAIVIDEINRGNISKIFGELITLVETDKRIGSENELTVTLPYSGNYFSVPSNLDIIGTMNTADRSLTHIDVALRRRFKFKELRTDYTLIPDNVEGINIRWLLYSINQRIELLLDREHVLGHALVMNIDSIESLQHVFITNIMPLLEEYFFENWGKIRQVLNDNGFIEEQKEANNTWLGGSDEYSTKSFRISSNAFKDIEAYKAIYSGVHSSAFSECEIKQAEM